MTKRVENVRAEIYPALLLLSAVDGCLDIGSFLFLLRAGGSIADANAFLSVFWLSMTLSELPTGYISDRLGPKRAVLVGLVLRGVAFAVYYAFPSRAGLALASAIAGFAVTFLSGMFQVQLKLLAARGDFALDPRRHTSEMMAIQGAGRVIGAAVFYIVTSRFSIAEIWPACGLLLAATISHLLGRWSYLSAPTASRPVAQLMSAIRHCRRSPQIMRALVVNALLVALTLPLVTQWIIVFFPELENTGATLATSVVAVSLFRSVFSLTRSHKAVRPSSPPVVLGLLGLATMGSSLGPTPLGFASLVLAFALLTEAQILVRTAILEDLPEAEGGTISSVQSLLENLAGVTTFALLAVALQRISLRQSWMISAMGIVALGIGVAVIPCRRPVPVR